MFVSSVDDVGNGCTDWCYNGNVVGNVVCGWFPNCAPKTPCVGVVVVCANGRLLFCPICCPVVIVCLGRLLNDGVFANCCGTVVGLLNNPPVVGCCGWLFIFPVIPPPNVGACWVVYVTEPKLVCLTKPGDNSPVVVVVAGVVVVLIVPNMLLFRDWLFWIVLLY